MRLLAVAERNEHHRSLFSIWLGTTKMMNDGYLGLGLDWTFGNRNPISVIWEQGCQITSGSLSPPFYSFFFFSWKRWDRSKHGRETRATDWHISFRLLHSFSLPFNSPFRNDTPWWNVFKIDGFGIALFEQRRACALQRRQVATSLWIKIFKAIPLSQVVSVPLLSFCLASYFYRVTDRIREVLISDILRSKPLLIARDQACFE